MARLHLPLLSALLVLQTATALKLFTLFNPYLIQAQSTAQVDKQEISEELPVYRDLPPIKKEETKDLTEALEATRNLKFTRPTLDADAFYASLRREAEVRNVIGDAPPFADIQIRKTNVIDIDKKSDGNKESVTSKSSNEAFQANAKAPATNLQVKRSENSFVRYIGGGSASLHKAGSDVAVSVQAPFTNVQVRKQVAVQGEPGETVVPEPVPTETSEAGVGVHVEAPFTNVQVHKPPGSVYTGGAAAAGAGVIVEAPFTSVKVQKGVNVGSDYSPPVAGAGVSVEAPFTSVKVQKGTGYGYPGLGTQVGVNVNVPFPSVKVKKVAVDVPVADLPTDTNVSGGGGSYHEAGVNVDVPFVKVKVGGPAVAKVAPPVVDDDQVPPKPLVGIGGFLLPKRPGKPLDLDINIPGIFNLRLLRDQAGRGRLGIGVLPIFSSWANPPPSSDSYPPPTTA